MYVALRELTVRGVALPLAVRVMLSGSAVVALRWWEWARGKPLLDSMYAHTHRHAATRGKEARQGD